MYNLLSASKRNKISCFTHLSKKYMELIKSLIIDYKYFPILNQVHNSMTSNNVQSQLNLVKYIDKAMYVKQNCN